MNEKIITNLIIERAMAAFGAANQKQLAEIFGILPEDLSNRKRRGTLLKLIEKEAFRRNISYDWIKTGTGTPSIVAEPQEKYNVAHLRRVTDNPEIKISELIQKTVYILESNTAHKVAIAQAINACYQSVLAEETIIEQKNKIKELEDENKALLGRLPPAASG